MKRVLVCDSDISMLALIKLQLNREGCEVKTLYDHCELVNEVRALPPDLILMDVDQWEKNAFTQLGRLKSDLSSCEIPVVVYSSDWNDKEKAGRLGADLFLNKPFEINDVMQCLQS